MMIRREFTKKLFDNALVFPNSRPYDLDISDFQRLCEVYAEVNLNTFVAFI